MADIKNALFYKNIKPEYDKSYVMTTGWNTSKDDLNNLFKSWGFSNIYVSGNLEWRIEEDPTYGPSLLIFDGGSNVEVRCLDDGFTFLKCKSKQDNYYQLLTADSSGYVSLVDYLETDYVAPGAYSIYISDLGFAKHIKDAFVRGGENYDSTYTAEFMKYNTVVDDSATSVTFNKNGVLGSGQFSIPGYKINNVNLNGWGFIPVECDESPDYGEYNVYRFKNNINLGSGFSMQKTYDFHMSYGSPSKIIVNDFNEETYKRHYIEKFDNKLYCHSNPFTIDDNEIVVLYRRGFYKGLSVSNDLNLKFTKSEWDDLSNSFSDLYTDFEIEGNLSIKCTPSNSLSSISTFTIKDITEELKNLKNGDLMYLDEFSGKRAPSWTKDIIVPCTYYLYKPSLKSDFKSETLMAYGRGHDDKINYNERMRWIYTILKSYNISFTSPSSFTALTIPDTVEEWKKREYKTGYSHYLKNDNTIDCKTQKTGFEFTMDLSINYTLYVPGGLFYNQDDNWKKMTYKITPLSYSGINHATFKKKQDWTEVGTAPSGVTQSETIYTIDGSNFYSPKPKITFKSTVYFAVSTPDTPPYALIKWKKCDY